MLGVANHHVANSARYLVAYLEDSGYAYLQHQPFTPSDRLLLENLGPTFDTMAALSVSSTPG